MSQGLLNVCNQYLRISGVSEGCPQYTQRRGGIRRNHNINTKSITLEAINAHFFPLSLLRYGTACFTSTFTEMFLLMKTIDSVSIFSLFNIFFLLQFLNSF